MKFLQTKKPLYSESVIFFLGNQFLNFIISKYYLKTIICYYLIVNKKSIHIFNLFYASINNFKILPMLNEIFQICHLVSIERK